MTVPVYAWFLVLLGEPLTMDGGSRLKGVNSLKSSEDLWGPVRWHSRLDPFPYSEPLTNLDSYIGARGISDKTRKQATGNEPEPSKCPQWSRQAVRTRISSRRGTHAQSLRDAAWECPPSRGRATDTREKESPLAILRPEVHRTVMVDSLREPNSRVFELTHLSVIIDRLDRFDARTSRSPIGDPYK
ncbi:hypothetical protein CRG98_031812 [Punica granatum]|uniref:Uncharacterized protein n=1 Tax=Punica granatum TaxID=22663 RepID=A0A2I0IWP6_PUNGR|nr:hypothetical protein CRG98_031812 [Punica granatum]